MQEWKCRKTAVDEIHAIGNRPRFGLAGRRALRRADGRPHESDNLDRGFRRVDGGEVGGLRACTFLVLFIDGVARRIIASRIYLAL